MNWSLRVRRWVGFAYCLTELQTHSVAFFTLTTAKMLTSVMICLILFCTFPLLKKRKVHYMSTAMCLETSIHFNPLVKPIHKSNYIIWESFIKISAKVFWEQQHYIQIYISLTLSIKVTFNCLCTNHWYGWFMHKPVSSANELRVPPAHVHVR